MQFEEVVSLEVQRIDFGPSGLWSMNNGTASGGLVSHCDSKLLLDLNLARTANAAEDNVGMFSLPIKS